MSQEQIQTLLLTHHLTPNKLLGQNFMVDPTLYSNLCEYATLTPSDIVLDVGAGFGFLTRFLSNKCHTVIAVEKDPQFIPVLRKNTQDLPNVSIVAGDVLKVQLPKFNKVIAIPPYYLSSQLVIWTLEQNINTAVMIVQKEFANRLLATVGSEEYSWLTVAVHQQANVTLHDEVPKDKFYPPPEVDSTILCLKSWTKKPFEVKNLTLFIQLTKLLFSERNKKLSKAITPFLRNNLKLDKHTAEKIAHTLPFAEHRPRELTPQDFGAILSALPN
ncbi:MAG: 16S rRNA (adenine(1518)-N(6)/adenine(1519)-N(6))-dimethyltransferase RsmA [Nitrososphaerota archaeon]|jgi:16S rRNA (adenine1518-N6/adenine1519-N6)-dimethyltransferase|nr:16S rRNA (adenine(1518)-N(6)/adenine(1519)-N(6))-dimethyltransferase RsmA [Nitrososphaerota archaeon]